MPYIPPIDEALDFESPDEEEITRGAPATGYQGPISDAPPAKIPRLNVPRKGPIDLAELQARLSRDKAALQVAANGKSAQTTKTQLIKSASTKAQLIKATYEAEKGLPPSDDSSKKSRHDDSSKKSRQDESSKKSRQESASEGAQIDANVGDVLETTPKLRIEEEVGTGHFSRVFRCTRLDTRQQIAVKVLRADSLTRLAAENEAAICREIRDSAIGADAGRDAYMIGLVAPEQVEYNGHLCLLFELGKWDLRNALNKDCKDGGFSIGKTKHFVSDMFHALSFLRDLGIIHADIKPHNFILTADRSHVKLTDFGSAMTAKLASCRPDLQPRYYRAPEVILGNPYGTQIDVWSAGAVAFELATGRVLFVANDNSSLLHEILKVTGAPSKSMIQSGKFASQYFDSSGGLRRADGKVLPSLSFEAPSEPIEDDLEQLLKDVPPAVVRVFADLIDKCLSIGVGRRIEPKQALAHEFLQD